MFKFCHSPFSIFSTDACRVFKVGVNGPDIRWLIPGWKINSALYRDALLGQNLLSFAREISGEFFIFKKESELTHRARIF